MLIDNKGREVNPKTLPANKAQRERILAQLREVFPVQHRHGDMFQLKARARLV